MDVMLWFDLIAPKDNFILPKFHLINLFQY